MTETRDRAESSGVEPKDSKRDYSADRPIDGPDQDRFDRWPFAQRVASTIGQREDPSSLVVGVYGPWGDGKTSVLRLLEHALKQNHPNIIVVKYNPWYFREVSQLLKGFFRTLGDAVEGSLNVSDSSWWSRSYRRARRSKETIGTLLNEYGSLLSVVESHAGSIAVEIGKSLSNYEIEKVRDRLGKDLRKAGKRVVVLIDDIDRLDQEEIRAVLKLVKLSASFEFVTYVLAFDDEIVAASLGEAYGGGEESGRRFLEKIVQVSLHLPPPDELELRKLALEGVDEALQLAGIQLTETQVNEFVRSFVIGLETALTTPRQAKRLQNALTFALPLLRNEVNPVDQLLIESLRAFYPGVYLAIRENPEVFLQSASSGGIGQSQGRNEEARKVIDEALAKLTKADQNSVKELLQALFPRLKGVFSNYIYGSDFDTRWEKEKRICAQGYFWRYFRYTVPRGDMRDTVLDALVRNAEQGKTVEVEREIMMTAEQGAIARLIQKLEHRAPEIDSPAAAILAATLARRGELFPHEQGAFAQVTEPFVRAAILIRKLFKRMPEEQRDALARKVVSEGRPLPFAAECFSWLRYKDEAEEINLVSEATQLELGREIAARIAEEDQEEPLYIRYPDRVGLLLWHWKKYGDAAKMSEQLGSRLKTHPEEIIRFLLPFTGKAWSMVTGLPARTEFGKDAFDSATSYVNVDLVMSILREQFGETIGEGEFHVADDVPADRQIAHQFAFLARQARETTGEGPQ